MVFAVALALALQAASPGAPSPVQPTGAAATSNAPAAPSRMPAEDMSKVVCRRQTVTGSRLGGETECMTKAQWRERQGSNAQNVREIQDRSNLTPRPGP